MSTTTRKTAAPATTAVYTRISKDRAQGAGVERQLDDCVALAKRRGWALAGRYEDNDVSASKYTRRKRPDYTRLMHEVTEGRVQRIIAWKLDRLYRRPKELEALIDLAEQGHVEIVTVMGGDIDLNTSAGRTMARVSVAMAAGSSDDTSERIVRQKAQRRAAGLPPGGVVPFGWANKTTIDKQQAKVLVAAMDAVLAGESLSGLAKKWNAEKVRGRGGWDANLIGKIITRPHHAGLLTHRGQVLDTPGTWKALIDRAKYEALVATVAGRAAAGAHAPKRRSMLTGLLVCGACGHTMYRSSSEGVSIWRCHKQASKGVACGKVNVRTALIEPLVVEATMQYVDGLDLAKLLRKSGAHSGQANIAQELAKLDRREADMGAAVAAGSVKVIAMEAFTRSIEAQREALRSKLSAQVRVGALAPFAGKAGALRATWSQLTTDQQRGIVAEALQVVVVKPVTHRGQRFEKKRVEVGAPVSGWDTLTAEQRRALIVIQHGNAGKPLGR
jgi:DNA invertase Pin-like site-specific DNA recombinase